MNRSLSYVNLSLELHVVSPFWLGSDTSGTFSLHFSQPSYELGETSMTGKCSYVGAELTFLAAKISAKVSLMLYNPFLVPSPCKLNHISPCFIQISTKITCKQLIHFRKSHVFFELIPGVLGWSLNFNITYRFLLRRAVFPDYPFPCDYAHHIHLILEENFGGNPWKACKKWPSRQFILFLSLQIRKVFKWFSQ